MPPSIGKQERRNAMSRKIKNKTATGISVKDLLLPANKEVLVDETSYFSRKGMLDHFESCGMITVGVIKDKPAKANQPPLKVDMSEMDFMKNRDKVKEIGHAEPSPKKVTKADVMPPAPAPAPAKAAE